MTPEWGWVCGSQIRLNLPHDTMDPFSGLRTEVTSFLADIQARGQASMVSGIGHGPVASINAVRSWHEGAAARARSPRWR